MTKGLHKNWGGILMMGGRAQRMGRLDKGTLQLRGRSFKKITISRLETTCHKVAVSTGSKPNTDINGVQFTDVTIQGDLIGPVGGLLSALEWADSLGLRGILTLPVDTPILPDNLCEALLASGGPSYASHGSQSHWLHAVWPLSFAADIRRHVFENQVFSLHRLHRIIGSTPVKFPIGNDGAFKNINTANDLEALQKASKNVPTI